MDQWPRRSRVTTSGPTPSRLEAQAVVGEQQCFQVHLVGQGLAQRRLFVGHALARQRLGPGQAGGCSAAVGRQRGDRAHGVGKQAPRALGGGCGGTLAGGVFSGQACVFRRARTHPVRPGHAAGGAGRAAVPFVSGRAGGRRAA
jgi:hypothetical protein